MCRMVSHIKPKVANQVSVANLNVTNKLYHQQKPNFIFKTDLSRNRNADQ